MTCNVKRWRGRDMRRRWVGLAISQAAKRFTASMALENYRFSYGPFVNRTGVAPVQPDSVALLRHFAAYCGFLARGLRATASSLRCSQYNKYCCAAHSSGAALAPRRETLATASK